MFDFLYVVTRVSVSSRTLQCRVGHFTPTYVMTQGRRHEIVSGGLKFYLFVI